MQRGGPHPLRAAALVRLRALPAADAACARRDARARARLRLPGAGRAAARGASAITGLPGVPTIFQVLARRCAGLAERELPDLRFLTNAGAALPAATVAGGAPRPSRTPRLYSMYGLTECKRVSYLPPDQLDARPDVGRDRDPRHRGVDRGRGRRASSAPGEVGELMVRGPHVMQGYWGDPRSHGERLRPGRWPWERVLATGDLFRADERGLPVLRRAAATT